MYTIQLQNYNMSCYEPISINTVTFQMLKEERWTSNMNL